VKVQGGREDSTAGARRVEGWVENRTGQAVAALITGLTATLIVWAIPGRSWSAPSAAWSETGAD
jgi:hypothetical protein